MRAAVVGTTLVTVLLAIGAADYWFVERPQIPAGSSASSGSAVSSEAMDGSSASVQSPVKKGVQKQSTQTVQELMQAIGISVQDTQEKSLLERINPSSTPVQTKVLLAENDRGALLSWMDTPDAKTIFFALKQSLLPTLSQQTANLIDKTVEPDDGPPYDLLSFNDPTISQGTIIFVRVRTRLYSLEVAPGRESAMRQVLDALTR